MTMTLADVVRRELSTPVPEPIRAFAADLARMRGAVAVLFYGSILRTGDLDGVLDFYLLTEEPHRRGLHGLLERRLWPEVSYHERAADGRTLRAKAATMTLGEFRAAAEGRRLDTTIWARFVQPSALVWTKDVAVAADIESSIAAAIATAARYAAALGPDSGEAGDFWRSLFRRTYAAELRVEPPGRESQILAAFPGRYEALLPLAWAAGGVAFIEVRGALQPEQPSLRGAWRRRVLAGKPLNIARLAKAAFTFEGAARYAVWKVERHTGVAIPLSPWAERHPVLAAPGAAWRLWRATRKR